MMESEGIDFHGGLGQVYNISRSYSMVRKFLWRKLLTTHVVILIMTASCQAVTATSTPSDIAFAEDEIREVSSVIADFESLWLSEQSHKDPAFQAELATGEYLDHLGYVNAHIESEVEWWVTNAAELKSLQLIEYEQQRFKAEACVLKSGRKIRPNGDFIGLFSDVRVCGIYVFVKPENKWKLLGFLNNMDSRSYERTPDWLREIIGEIPQK
jgi:hypothetical protein